MASPSSSKRKRTVITEIQKNTLEQFYSEGMRYKGMRCLEQIRKAVFRTGLSENVVKEWIGNRNKRDGHITPVARNSTPKKSYTKGVSAYNAFVHEHKEELGNMGSAWSLAWNAKKPEEKEVYKQRALELRMHREDFKKTRSRLLSNIDSNITSLSKMGVSLVCLGIDSTDGSQIHFGRGVVDEYISHNEQILHNMISFCEARSAKNMDSDKKTDIKALKTSATEHMNMLYAKAVGKNKPFPYKKVFNGELEVKGLPEEIMPLRFLSHYGTKKLQAILECKSIEIIQQSAQPCSPKSDGQPVNIHMRESFTNVEPLDISHEVTKAAEVEEVAEAMVIGLSAEDVEAVAPLFPDIQPVKEVTKAAEVEEVAEAMVIGLSAEDVEAVAPLFPDIQPVKEVTKAAEVEEVAEAMVIGLSAEDVEAVAPLFPDIQPVKEVTKAAEVEEVAEAMVIGLSAEDVEAVAPLFPDIQPVKGELAKKKRAWTKEENNLLQQRFESYFLGITKAIHNTQIEDVQKMCPSLCLRTKAQIRSKLSNMKLGKST